MRKLAINQPLYTMRETSQRLNVHEKTVRIIAKKFGWEQVVTTRRGREQECYRREDVQAAREWMSTLPGPGAPCRPEERGRAAALVEWADSLDAWPTEAEIRARMSHVYRFKDICSIIENRPARGKPKLSRQGVRHAYHTSTGRRHGASDL